MPGAAESRRLVFSRAPLSPSDGETQHLYCHDCIPCGCPPLGTFQTIAVVAVASTARYTRCLQCDARWTPRRYRSDPAVLLAREV